MKNEKYKGLTIIFTEVKTAVPDSSGKSHIETWIVAGFPKNHHIVSGISKERAFEKMKQVIAGIDPVVLKTYQKYPKVMAELEVL